MRALFLFALMSGILNAQTVKEQILANTWYLTEINIDGQSYNPPSNEEIGIITMGIDPVPDNDIMFWFHSEICSSSLEGYITWYSDYQINFFDFFGGFQCTIPENQDFEYLYVSFFAPDDIFDCSIIENSDSSLNLTILDESGNTVTYTNQLMSVVENEKLNFTFYPNPVKDKLSIENPELKITSVRVTDTTGKVIINQLVLGKRHEINFSHLPKGVYFIQFEENGKVLKTEKVIKK